ncbi:MAG: glycosyltransferase family 4 protein [Lentisphaeria bacterium]|nr:glycosyltransferase family 4 protein [Lentisphaeria bacterium]
MPEKQRILYILGSYPRWSETFIRRDLTLLLEAGLPLVPVSLLSGDTERRDDWPEVECLTQESHPSAVGGRSAMRWVARLLPRSIRTRLALRKHAALLQNVIRAANENDVVHIHAEFADLPGLLGAVAAERLDLPFSLGVHAKDVHEAKFSPDLIYGRAIFVMACNRSAAEAVRALCPSVASRVHLIHHGVDLNLFPFAEDPLEPNPHRLLFVGRMVEKKGLDTLLKALAVLRVNRPGARLILVGDGPLRGELQCLADTLDLQNALDWRGVVTPEEVKDIMDQSDVLVMPSRVTREGDRDGIPNVVLEAMACGLPVVGTKAGSLDEALTPETGWPVSRDDSAELASAIECCLAGRNEADRRRRTAAALVTERFSAHERITQRVQLFTQTLA